MTADWKESSPTAKGSPPRGSFADHLPHTGPSLNRAAGTRFFAWQEGQLRTRALSAMQTSWISRSRGA